MRRCVNQWEWETMLTDIADEDADQVGPDLSRLSDDELELLGRLLLKAAGEFEGDVNPPFRIEFVERGQNLIESKAAEDALADCPRSS
jgi:hypothetical protein